MVRPLPATAPSSRALYAHERAPRLSRAAIAALCPTASPSRRERSAFVATYADAGAARPPLVAVAPLPPASDAPRATSDEALAALATPALVAALAPHRDAIAVAFTDPAARRAIVGEFAASVILQLRRLTGAFFAAVAPPYTVSALAREYPVLARAAADEAARAAVALVTLAERLTTDRARLAARLGVSADAPVVAVERAGDAHAGGHTVAIVVLADGARVVYKPRSVRPERGFAAVAAWLAARGGVALAQPRVVDRGAYGWVEYVAPDPCPDRAAAARAYYRFGYLVALAHALRISDLHAENIRFRGEHPVVIDLETVLQPSILRTHHARSYEVRTVLATLLVPTGVGLDAETPPPLHGMATVAGEHNLPSRDGVPWAPADFADEIVAGLRGGGATIARHRDALARLAARAFARCPVRVLLRDTALYGHILEHGMQPALAADALRRERFVNALWLAQAHYPTLRRTVASERRQLLAGDIPRVFVTADGRDLLDEHGVVAAGLLSRTPLDDVADRLRRLDDGEIERQVAVLRSALALLAAPRVVAAPPAHAPATADDLAAAALDAAREVAERIVHAGVREGRRLRLLGLQPGRGEQLHLRELPVDLYDGYAGVLCFLLRLDEVCPGAVAPVHVHGIAESLLDRLSTWRGDRVGGYCGVGGHLLALSTYAARWPSRRAATACLGLVRRLAAAVSVDRHLDVLSGAAGAALAAAAAPLPDATRDVLIDAAARRLAESATEEPVGVGWRTIDGASQTGLSHGATGIALALALAGDRLANPSWTALARAALAYEDSRFDPRACAWDDLRFPSQRCEDMLAWCNGAVGIALGRLRLRRWLGDRAVDDALLVRCADKLLAAGPSGGTSLCHGDAGNLEYLLELDRGALLDADRSRHARRWARWVVQAAREDRGHGHEARHPTPGLMLGRAGLGDACLRLADPRLPSLLVLAPGR